MQDQTCQPCLPFTREKWNEQTMPHKNDVDTVGLDAVAQSQCVYIEQHTRWNFPSCAWPHKYKRKAHTQGVEGQSRMSNRLLQHSRDSNYSSGPALCDACSPYRNHLWRSILSHLR